MTDNELNKIWKSMKGELEVVSNPSHFKTHLPGTYIKDIDEKDKLIEFTSPSDFQKNRVEDFFYGHLKAISEKVLGEKYHITFTVTKKEPLKISANDLGPLFIQDEKAAEENATEKSIDAGLNPQYTMGRFIVGNNNRLAYAVSTAIADAPGKVYNPFFLYSGVGMGKTHLVQAIGHEVLKKHPDLKILYKTGEEFLNEVIEAVRRKQGGGGELKSSALKRKYRNIDVLIIDDVHSIAGKPTTQEEFFHTFNALYMSQKQIILTSDRAPHEISTLEERLSSRFSSGMIADIQPPDIETRIAILKNRNDELNLGASADVIEMIAVAVNTNIRELEAKLIQAVTKARSEGKELTKALTSTIINQIDYEKQRRITPNAILREVCKYYGITIKEIKGKRRLKNLVLPRQVCMYLLRDIIEMGYQSIGDLLGGRDHTTILHGFGKIESSLNNNSSFSKEIEQIKTNISLAS